VALEERGAAYGGPQFVTDSKPSKDGKNYCFVDVGHVELKLIALMMDGIEMEGNSLKIRKVNNRLDSTPDGSSGPIFEHQLPQLNLKALRIIPTDVPDSDRKLFIGGFSHHLTTAHLKAILEPFGPIARFNLVKDANTLDNKGYAFFEYETDEAATSCITQLNGMSTVTGGTLKVKYLTRDQACTT